MQPRANQTYTRRKQNNQEIQGKNRGECTPPRKETQKDMLPRPLNGWLGTPKAAGGGLEEKEELWKRRRWSGRGEERLEERMRRGSERRGKIVLMQGRQHSIKTPTTKGWPHKPIMNMDPPFTKWQLMVHGLPANARLPTAWAQGCQWGAGALAPRTKTQINLSAGARVLN